MQRQKKTPVNKSPGSKDESHAKQLRLNNTGEKEWSQQHSPELLVGSYHQLNNWLDGCPSASTLVGKSLALDKWVVIQIRCKRWGCRHCGERKVASFARRVEAAKPNRLITLTVDPKLYNSPRDAFDKTRRKLCDLNRIIRKEIGKWEYFRVLEATKAGWPHYHIVARCPYISQRWLSGVWARMTGAPIVDVRQIKKGQRVYWYVVKYLAKQQHIQWTSRRVTWSRNFWDDGDFVPKDGLNLMMQEMYYDTPSQHLWDKYQGCDLTRYSKDCWTVKFDRNKPYVPDPTHPDAAQLAAGVNPDIRPSTIHNA